MCIDTRRVISMQSPGLQPYPSSPYPMEGAYFCKTDRENRREKGRKGAKRRGREEEKE